MDEKKSLNIAEEENDSSLESLEIGEIIQTSQENKQKKHSFTYHVESGMALFLATFGVLFMIFHLVFQVLLTPIKVVGTSMQPTINLSVESNVDEDHCDIVYYNADKSYQNNDIVIVSNNNNEYINDSDVDFLIKRVIACPGQSITFFLTKTEGFLLARVYYYDFVVKDSNGNVIEIDDSFITEEMSFSETEYLSYLTNTDFSYFSEVFANLRNYATDESKAQTTIQITDNEYFVMGDNRNNSTDSRFFGAVTKNTISGEVKLQVPYGKNIWQAIWIKLKSIF